MKSVLLQDYSSTKIAIVGAGFVGSTTAYALMLSGVAQEIVLVDVNREKAEGEALDLVHCMQFTTSCRINAGDDFALVKDAVIIIITAGIAQKVGQVRTDLLAANTAVFREIIPKIVAHNNDAILLVVSNPLDVLTYLTLKMSNFAPCRVIGAGTVLDTARLRYLLGDYFKISPKDITAYMLGEHGDSEFVWWSGANIAGVSLHHFPQFDANIMKELYDQAKNAAYQIISKKGATYYAIALVVTKIVRAIVLDQSRVFTVSSYIRDAYGVADVCLSLPTVVRKSGLCEVLPLSLNNNESLLLKKSADKIRAEINMI